MGKLVCASQPDFIRLPAHYISRSAIPAQPYQSTRLIRSNRYEDSDGGDFGGEDEDEEEEEEEEDEEDPEVGEEEAAAPGM